MGIADTVITILVFVIQKALLPLLTWPIYFFSVADLNDLLAPPSGYLIQAFSGLGFFLPMLLIFSLFTIFLIAEIYLFGFKGVKYIINLFRGSGA